MNGTLKLFTCICLLIASCSRKEAESATKPLGKETPSHRDVLSLNFLRANQGDYVDQEVTVAAYLFTHEEGPWLADNLERPLADGMSLKITEASKLITKESSLFRWFEYHEGCPAILSGVFRIGRYETMINHYKENHPFIEVSQAMEVSTEDPAWKNRVSKGEAGSTNGEQRR
jgi:hypothetical protein